MNRKHGISRSLLLSLGIQFFLVSLAVANTAMAPREMVRVPAGEFFMGSTDRDILWAAEQFHSESLDYYRDETPARSLHLEAFDIDLREVTVGRYKDYMEATGHQPPRYFDNEKFNNNDLPVIGVTWQEAADYCAWAGKRLPTESEWEKAARGTDARYYPWGNDPAPERANIRGQKDGHRYTAAPGSFPQGSSPYGILDLAGNVWEWTSDWYEPHPGNDIPNDQYGKKFRVIKGGSWFSNLDLARASVRGKALPDQKLNYIGFRCARDAAGNP